MKNTNNKIINHENFGVAVIVIQPESNKILLGLRLNNYRAGFFGLPGGRVDFDESLIDGANRELHEETNLTSKKLSFLGVIREQQYDHTFIHFGYFVNSYSGILRNMEPEKCEGWKWYDLNNLPAKILPGHKALIDIFLNPSMGVIRDMNPLRI